MVHKTKNILVTGASGFVGPYVIDELLKKQLAGDIGSIYAVYNSHPFQTRGVETFKCDLNRQEDLVRLFSETNPDIVIHLASGTPTRISGQNDDYIRTINVKTTGQIAELSALNNSLMIYTSSDLVYDSGLNLLEDSSKTNPMTTYAKTKLDGEEAVRNNASKYIIFRTALVYGFSRSVYKSFFDTAYSILSSGEQLRAFTDQYRNAIYVEDVAATLALIPLIYKNNDTINLCGNEYLSRFDMCILMSEIFGLDRKLIIPASTDEFTLYPMIRQIGLNCGKLKQMGFRTFSYRQNLLRAFNYKPE